MADTDDMSFEQWLEKESQAMDELYGELEASGVGQELRRTADAPSPEAHADPAPEESAPEQSAPEGESVPEPVAEKAPEQVTEDAPEAPFALEASFRPEEHAAPAEEMEFQKESAPAREPARPRTEAEPAAPQAREPLRSQVPARRPVRYSGESRPGTQPPQGRTGQQPPRRPPVQTVQPDQARRPSRGPRPGYGDGGRGGDNGGGNKWLNWLIPFAAVLMVAVIVLAVGFRQARKVEQLDTIYPNVYVNGVNVGGMTVEEAAALLGDDADRYENAAVTVNFPTGDSVTVTAQDLGLKPADGLACALMAYAYGRDGSLLDNWKTYRACKSEPVELTADVEQSQLDQAALMGIIVPAVRQVNEKLGVTKADVSEDEITLVKNVGTVRMDEQQVCKLVEEAFAKEDYTPIDCQLPEPGSQTGQSGSDDGGALLQELYDRVFVEAVNAQYDRVTSGATESVQGVRFDMDEAKRLWLQAKPGETITIPLIKEEPEVSTEQLQQKLFADVLSEKSTSLAGSTSARINNITLAANALNGTIIQPGDEFDYNTTVGQRTEAKGYQGAGAYENGKHVTSIGGGICQDSSTLYYCALYANLQITVRYNHYFLVTYLPRGLDATVSWGGPDFRFRNNRDYPIKIEAYVSGGYLTVRLLGTDVDGSYVQITSDTWEDSQYYYAQTYRNVYDKNGNLISSAKEAYSSYHKEEAATPTPAPTATPAPTEPAESAPPPESAPPVSTQEPEASPEPVSTPEPVTTPEPEAPPEPVSTPEPETPPEGSQG